jgi:hypothetical protein
MPGTDRRESQIYQLRAVLRGISSLVRRRLLVRGDSTVAQLHEVLQIAVGWADEHLNRFEIRGREYAVYRDGGGMLGIDAMHVRLCDVKLRRLERFVYEYDFGDSWIHDLRLETTLPINPRKVYPMCGCFEVIAGKSIPEEGPPKVFAGVRRVDTKPKRRLHEVLRAQGVLPRQQVICLSDGGDTVRELPAYPQPHSEHILDWFHIAMRVAQISQTARGFRGTYDCPMSKEKILKELERAKWFLWYGNVFRADEKLTDLMFEVDSEFKHSMAIYTPRSSIGIRTLDTYARRNWLPEYPQLPVTLYLEGLKIG